MHEVGIVGQRHLFRVDGPTAVRVENLAVVGIGIGCPVLGVDEVRAFERYLMVIFYASVADEARVQFVAFRVGDDKLVVRRIHPFGETVRHGLRQGFRMWCPSHDDFRTGSLLILLDRDQVGKTLQRMAGSRFHAEYRTAGVLDELVQYLFVVIIFLAFETGE